MCYTYQKKNLELLKEHLDFHLLMVKGTRGSGRSDTIRQLDRNGYSTIEINPESGALSAIKNAFNKDKNFKKEILSVEPSVSVSGMVLGIGATVKIQKLNWKEQFLMRLLRKNCKKGKWILIIRDYNQIDTESRNFIEKVCKNIDKFQNNLTIIFLTDEADPVKPVCGDIKLLSFLDVCYDFAVFSADVNSQLEHKLNQDELAFMFYNIHGNIDRLVGLIQNLSVCDFNRPSEKLFREIESLVDKEIEQENVLNALKFISIIEEDVRSNDLAFLLNTQNNLVDVELQTAVQKKILEFEHSKWEFTLKLLRNIFLEKSQLELILLYNKVVKLYETLYPSKYEKMFYYAKKANDEKFIQYYVQYILKQIRCNPIHHINFDEIKKNIEEEHIINFIKTYRKAVNEMAVDNFMAANKTLKELDVTGYLRLEKNLLWSQSLIKSIDGADRETALRLLQLNNDEVDKNLLYRYSVRRISAYVHMGKYSEAQTEFEQLEDRLQKDYNINHSEEIQGYLNVINRRCNNVLSCDLAKQRMKMAVEEYRKQTFNPIGYYIALCNYFAINIMNYDLICAKEIRAEIEKLEKEFSSLVFPRKYIFMNDVILYEYFSGQCTAQDAELRLRKLYDSCACNQNQGDRADQLFYRSNLSIFLAMNGKIELAIKELEDEKKKLQSDKEGIYDFRVTVNLAIYKFIQDNRNRDKCLNELNRITLTGAMPDYQWQNRKMQRIKTVMQHETVSDVNNWMSKIEDKIADISPDPFLYYGKPFVYTTVFNWDDD